MSQEQHAQSASPGGYWLEPHTPEYDQISYYLSACVGENAVAVNLEIWKVENLDLNYRYEQHTVSMMKLPVWVNSATLSKENSLERVCKKGFELGTANANDCLFSTGVIDFGGERSGAHQDYSFLFCEVAIGRAAVFDGDLSEAQVPMGYNSLYIPHQPLDRNYDGKFSLQEYQAAANFDEREASQYRHQYVIRNNFQVLPKYIVRFQLNFTSEDVAIAEHPDLISHVGHLEDQEELMFDPVSFVTVSKKEQESLSGISQSARQNLISVDQAFSQAVEDGGIVDTVAESKCKWIDRQLTILDDKVRTVNLNYAEISEAILAASDDTSKKLQFMTRQKLETCLSMEIELRRQQEQVKWLDNAISAKLNDVQLKLRSSKWNAVERYRLKLDFLRNWKSHMILRNSVSRSKPVELQALSHIHADIKLHSGLSLYFDPFFSNGVQSDRDGSISSAQPGVDVVAGRNTVHGDTGEASGGYGDSSNASFLNELMQRSSRFEMPAKPLESLVSVALRNLVQGEIEIIQNAIERAVDDVQDRTMKATRSTGSLPAIMPILSLPQSIVRPVVSGDRYSAPLHNLLDHLEDCNRGYSTRYPDCDDATSNKFEDLTAEKFGTILPSGTLSEPKGVFNSAMDKILSGAPTAKPEDKNPDSPVPIDKRHTPSAPSYAPSSTTTSPFRDTSDMASRLSSPSLLSSQKSLLLPASARQGKKQSEFTEVPTIAASNNPQSINLTVNQLNKVISPFTQYSLLEMSKRKRAQLEAKQISGFEAGMRSLSSSKIIGQVPSAAESLYFSLPFFAKPPVCKLIYSTDTCVRSLDELYAKTMHSFKGPTLAIIRSGEFIFGFYVTHQIAPTCTWSGSPACFLYSLTLDVKLPYHAKVPPTNVGDGLARLPKLQEPTAFFAQSEYLFIGNGDLSLDASLTNGSSELENCFGIGLGLNSAEALCLLAGSPLFMIDDMEIWAVIA